VLAVDDRSGPPHLGGKAAINRFRSISEISKGERLTSNSQRRQGRKASARTMGAY
jgi:hypothetical protein